MEPIQDQYPVFEANQVLSSGHLNDVFDYLDQQGRLTRTQLIGVGIACGLELRLDTGPELAVLISRGCGVTSLGYLAREMEDVRLIAYRANYILPSEVDYPQFKDAAQTQYPLWELLPAGEPNATPLQSTPALLDDKAVLLFVELKKEALRNCSPNNCDDKGSHVVVSSRRLLILRSDLDKVIASANALASGLTASDLAASLLTELNLPDLRVPRFDVPNTSPVTSNDIFGALLDVIRSSKLATATGNALSAAYLAFLPLLQDAYPVNPFAEFAGTLGFLDKTPVNADQVRFLQYYVDLFEDLLRAYDEFRWCGVDLLCGCCPADDIFPRHLMLGLLHPESVTQPSVYRQRFVPAGAVSDCTDRHHDLLNLFARLVEMYKRFTNRPSLPASAGVARMDPQIRITPSRWGTALLSERAIPYYYEQTGSPPLYGLWDVIKTRRNRANQNLGFRYDEFSPPAPAFISSPLRYDLEPNDFLRIEGHLGKNYQSVLSTLLLQKRQFRLPIDVIALRSGAYDDNQAVDPASAGAQFQDLQAVYGTLREELLSTLCEGIRFLYDVPLAGSALVAGTPKHPLLQAYASNYVYPAGSVGAWYEKYLTVFQSRPYIDVDQNHIDSNEVVKVYCNLFYGTADLPQANFAHVVSIYYFSKLAEILPTTLDALAYADFENKYQDLLGLVRFFRSEAAGRVTADLQAFIPQDALISHFDETLYSCRLEPMRVLHDEYLRRLRNLKQQLFLSNFLQHHPGIQHKGGVTLGGTFILVYHQDPDPVVSPGRSTAVNLAALGAMLRTPRAGPIEAAASPARLAAATVLRIDTSKLNVEESSLNDAITRIASDHTFAANPDIKLILGSLAGDVTIPGLVKPYFPQTDPASKIIRSTVDQLLNGTVIADFFLPYQLAAGAGAVQFVLPKIPPEFTIAVGCASTEGVAVVTVTAAGGLPPYEVKLDDQAYQPLTRDVPVAVGKHTLLIRDSEGTESGSQAVTVAAPITFGEVAYLCADDFSTYTASVDVTGGQAPYTADGVAFVGNRFSSASIANGAEQSIDIADANQCSATLKLSHTCVKPCDLPCAGIALRRGYRFWLPEPTNADQPYKLKVARLTFSFEYPQGQQYDLSNDVSAIIAAAPATLASAFVKTVNEWLTAINKKISEITGKADWLTLNYESGLTGGLGTLWIEYFECLTFDIQISSQYQRPEIQEQLIAVYAPSGSTLSRTIGTSEEKVTIPAFDGTKRDKCHPVKPVEPLCQPPNLPLKIVQKVAADGFTVNLSVTPPDAAPAYLWEIQDAQPSMANGSKVNRAKFPTGTTGSKLIRVTGFTKEGCTTTVQDTIKFD